VLERSLSFRNRVLAGTRSNSATASVASDIPAARRAPFYAALVRHDVFRRLWLSALGSSIGQWMQQIALGWLAIVMTDSPAFVGIVTFCAGLPYIVVAPLGGSLIDRLDRRRLMLACQALAILLAVAMAGDVVSGFVQPWHLPVAAFCNGALQALLTPTQQSLAPGLVPREDLTNAVGLMSAGQNMTRVIGPSIAGIVIGALGVGPTFLMQAAAIAAAFVLVWTILLPPRAPRAAGRSGVFEGIRLIASRPDLRGLFLLAAIPTFFIFPYLGFLNIFARDILRIGAGGLGLLMAVSGSGAVVGALVVASSTRSDGAGRLLVWMTVVYGAALVGIAASRSLWITLPLLFISGVIGSAFFSGNNVLLQHRISDDVRGRVMGVYMLTWGLMPLGSLPMGMLAGRIGTPGAVAAGAIVSSVLAALLGLLSPALREL
jgi:predicted MFS family arabinose efflux permease